MDGIEKELLLRDIETLGYPLVRVNSVDPMKVLTQMIESSEIRILEGVPVVLANTLSNGFGEKFLEMVELELHAQWKKRFRILSAITFLHSFWLPSSEKTREALGDYLKEKEPSLIRFVSSQLQEKKNITIGGGITLDASRLEKVFKDYVVQAYMDTRASLEKKIEAERSNFLRKSLSVLFTKKQIDILVKVMNKEALTKSEKEYYSRSIKPRLKAIGNPDVQSIARTLGG